MVQREMRRAGLLAALALAAGAALADGGSYPWPVVRVVDGDTVAVDASADMPPELADVKVRLRGVDTPEKGGRAKCDSERQAGQAATAFPVAVIKNASAVSVRAPAWGKWGGRVIADLIADGESLATLLIAQGHGRPYEGAVRGGQAGELVQLMLNPRGAVPMPRDPPR